MHLDEPCKGKVDMTEQQNINRRYPHTNEDNMLRQVRQVVENKIQGHVQTHDTEQAACGTQRMLNYKAEHHFRP